MFDWLFGNKKKKAEEAERLRREKEYHRLYTTPRHIIKEAGEGIQKGHAVYLKDDDLIYGAVKLKDIAKPEKNSDRISKMLEATQPINRSLNAPSYQEERKRYEDQNRPSKQEAVRRNYDSYSRELEEDNNKRRRDNDSTTDLLTNIALGVAVGSIFSDSSSGGDSSSSDSGSSGSDYSGGGGDFSGGGSSGDY